MINSKDILARLLATENLTVVHQNVRTASFNVKDRVLTLPIWEDMESFTYDHLVGHEVGHALYTPEDGWHESVSTRGPQFKSFLNVIEDARIEKLIQRKYPGLRRNFVKSYTKMFDDGFFGDDMDGINRLGLIDRINTYFKLGRASGVRIEADELEWVREIENVETWDQVVDIAERMYGDALDKVEAEAEARANDEEYNEEEDYDDDMTGLDPSDSEYEEDYKEEDDGESDEGEDTSAEGEYKSSNDAGDPEDGEPVESTETYSDGAGATGDVGSKTDAALRDRIAEELSDDNGNDVYNINTTFADKHAAKFIVPWKKTLETFADMNTAENSRGSKILHAGWKDDMIDFEKIGDDLLNKFMANNKKTINYLVKEFEMKKSAAAYARATVSKTGVIDPVLMNSYKYNDDIFRKVTNVPEGKNHGMIMYLDWSGSMTGDLYNTVEQTLNLVYFCRQVQIPFRVYAFTSHFDRIEGWDELKATADANTAMPDSTFRLIEFFNNKMNKQQIARMSKILLNLAREPYYVQSPYRLGGTPLDDAIAMSGAVYDLFQKTNRVDVVNTIYLTDGDSHSMNFLEEREGYNSGEVYKNVRDVSGVLGWRNNLNVVSITDSVSKKRYRLLRGQMTKTLLKMYRERTGSTVIGFRIASASKNSTIRDLNSFGINWNDANDMWTSLRKEKFVNVAGLGYDKFFMIRGGAALKTANGAFEVADDAKKGQIASAFKKANKSKLVSRTMLNEFIKEVA